MIAGDLLRVKYPHFGGDIVCHPTKTTTVLGKFNDPVSAGGGTSLIKSSKVYKYGDNPGGVNLLDDPNWSWPLNDQWLRSVASRGDVLRAVSDPRIAASVWADAAQTVRSTFGKEVDLLQSLGYSFKPSSFQFVK